MRGACPLSTLPVMGYLSFRNSTSETVYCYRPTKPIVPCQRKRPLVRSITGKRVHSVCTEPVGGYAMTAFPHRGKAERELPRRKTGLAACGRRHTRRHNDTPALNTLKVLRGAPISMGRCETPVRLQLTTARFAF